MSNPRQSYKVTAPVARSTAYDYNATLSKSHTRMANPSGKTMTAVQCTEDEDRDVMPHEILFEHKGRAQTNNARICSASSVNGVTLGHACVTAVRACLRTCGCPHAAAFQEPMLPAHADAATRDLIAWLDLPAHRAHREKVSDVLTSFFNYMGVAVTGCTSGPRGGALQRQGFSATRGGLMTIVNTGSTPLRAGDKVRMVIDVIDVVRGMRPPSDQITGIPRTKVVARLAHLPVGSSHVFGDVANGVTTRDMTVHMHLPGILTPALEYMGRLRYPWDWDHGNVDLGPGLRGMYRAAAAWPATIPDDTGIAGVIADIQNGQQSNFNVNAAYTTISSRLEWLKAGNGTPQEVQAAEQVKAQQQARGPEAFARWQAYDQDALNASLADLTYQALQNAVNQHGVNVALSDLAFLLLRACELRYSHLATDAGTTALVAMVRPMMRNYYGAIVGVAPAAADCLIQHTCRLAHSTGWVDNHAEVRQMAARLYGVLQYRQTNRAEYDAACVAADNARQQAEAARVVRANNGIAMNTAVETDLVAIGGNFDAGRAQVFRQRIQAEQEDERQKAQVAHGNTEKSGQHTAVPAALVARLAQYCGNGFT